jgi:hypothetical protein
MSITDIRLFKAEKHNPLHTYQSERFAPTNIVTGVMILFKANRPDTDDYFDMQRREALRRSKGCQSSLPTSNDSYGFNQTFDDTLFAGGTCDDGYERGLIGLS